MAGNDDVQLVVARQADHFTDVRCAAHANDQFHLALDHRYQGFQVGPGQPQFSGCALIEAAAVAREPPHVIEVRSKGGDGGSTRAAGDGRSSLAKGEDHRCAGANHRV